MNTHIKYRQLRAFALVVETGSFRAAADRLAVTQSSFSALIKELEQDLGVVLLSRTTRRCELTDSGRAFHDEIKSSLDRLEDAYRHAQEVGAGNLGKLSLAALPSLCAGILVRKLAEFQRRYPGVRISLSERGHEKTLEAVSRGDVEVGIGSMPRADKSLSFQPVMTDRLMIVAPTGHPLNTMRAQWKSLEKFPLVYMMAGPAERALRTTNVQSEPVFEVEQASTALAMVRHGMGVTVLPSSIVPYLNTDGLVCRSVTGKFAVRQLGIIQRANTSPSAPARAFAQMLKESPME